MSRQARDDESSGPGLVQIALGEPGYPSSLGRYLGSTAPQTIAALGNLDILHRPAFGMFCSVKCPGNLILQTYDLAQEWREAGVPVIGGFHSPMERECLTILLRGTAPVIVCPARSIEGMRVRSEYKPPLADGRLLLLSPFSPGYGRNTSETSVRRNRFVAALADRVFIAHAAPGSKTEALCREIVEWGKSLYTLPCDDNAHLIALGARLLPDQLLI